MLSKNLEMFFSLEHFQETLEAIRPDLFEGSKSDLCPQRKAIHHPRLRHINSVLSQTSPGPTEAHGAFCAFCVGH